MSPGSSRDRVKSRGFAGAEAVRTWACPARHQPASKQSYEVRGGRGRTLPCIVHLYLLVHTSCATVIEGCGQVIRKSSRLFLKRVVFVQAICKVTIHHSCASNSQKVTTTWTERVMASHQGGHRGKCETT